MRPSKEHQFNLSCHWWYLDEPFGCLSPASWRHDLYTAQCDVVEHGNSHLVSRMCLAVNIMKRQRTRQRAARITYIWFNTSSRRGVCLACCQELEVCRINTFQSFIVLRDIMRTLPVWSIDGGIIMVVMILLLPLASTSVRWLLFGCWYILELRSQWHVAAGVLQGRTRRFLLTSTIFRFCYRGISKKILEMGLTVPRSIGDQSCICVSWIHSFTFIKVLVGSPASAIQIFSGFGT